MSSNAMNPTFEIDDLLRHQAFLKRMARGLTRDESSAEDLVQQTWLAVLDEPRADLGSPRNFLARILRRLAINRHVEGTRRKRRERQSAQKETLPPTDHVVAELDLHAKIVHAVHALPEPYRSTLYMRYYHDLGPQEIARRSGLPLSTVKARLRHGLERLRRRLDAQAHGDRRAWCSVLVPLVSTNHAKTTVASMGAFAMGTQLKIVTVSTALILGIVATYLISRTEDRIDNSPVGKRPEARLIIQPPSNSEGSPESERQRVDLPTSPEREKKPSVPAKEFTIHGRLLGLDSNPRAHTEVRFVPRTGSPPSRTSRSNPKGEFRFDKIQSAGRIVCGEEGWITVVEGYIDDPRDDSPETIVIACPSLVLEGNVVDGDGHPLEDVNVELKLPPGFRSRFSEVLDYSRTVRSRTRSDTSGSFRLVGPAGVDGALLTASLAGYPELTELAPQQSSPSMRLVLSRRPSADHYLQGTVLDPVGLPVEGARVSFGAEVTTTDARGRFGLDADPQIPANETILHRLGEASRTLVALADGYRPAILQVDADDDGTPLWPKDVVLQFAGEPLSLSGRVVDELGQGLPDRTVYLRDPTYFTVAKRQKIESLLGGLEDDRFPKVKTDAQGYFTLNGLSDRRYHLCAMNSKTMHTSPVVGVHAGTDDVRLVLDSREVWERIAGHVLTRDGAPVPNATLRCVCRPLEDARHQGREVESPYWVRSTIRTDSNGAFMVPDVPREGVFFIVQGPGILDGTFGLPKEGGLEALARGSVTDIVFTAERRVHAQVFSSEEGIDRVEFRNAKDQALTYRIVDGKSFPPTISLPLSQGRSDVVSLSDEAIEIVLFQGKLEVRRHPIELLPDSINFIRP